MNKCIKIIFKNICKLVISCHLTDLLSLTKLKMRGKRNILKTKMLGQHVIRMYSKVSELALCCSPCKNLTHPAAVYGYGANLQIIGHAAFYGCVSSPHSFFILSLKTSRFIPRVMPSTEGKKEKKKTAFHSVAYYSEGDSLDDLVLSCKETLQSDRGACSDHRQLRD